MSESQLGPQMRVACFGQDTSRLYEREDGKKPWRAETPAGPGEKVAAKAWLVEFHEAWPLACLRLNTVHLEHVARLQGALTSASPGRKAALLHRLKMAEAAAERLQGFVILYDAARALLGCNSFISYIHDQPHGTRVALRAKGRADPYEVGKLKGAHAMLEPVCTSLEHMPALTLAVCAFRPAGDDAGARALRHGQRPRQARDAHGRIVRG